MAHDGNLVSELGVKKYVQAYKALPFSNVQHMENDAFYQRKWEACDFGCHTPSYRRVTADTSYDVFIGSLNDQSTLLAGVVDGVHAQAIKKPTRIAQGATRTAEGLGLAGEERFKQVGGENLVVLDAFTAVIRKSMDLDIAAILSPVAQCVTTVVSTYVSLLPHEYIHAVAKAGAIKVPTDYDKGFLKVAGELGIIPTPSLPDLADAQSLLQGTSGRIIGKQIGVRTTQALTSIIIYNISLQILKSPDLSRKVKKEFRALRKAAKGNLATVLAGLLQANGMLADCASYSRRLKQDCPRLWQLMRYDLKGVDMLLFLVSGYLSEYLDRIKLLETDPVMFASTMHALIRSGKTKEVFFPKRI
ncbi:MULTISPECIES: hypothetical protein [Corallincola]|uniref:Uncharacterized protein n=2 Tax=Corallincola TaxID=1775176 RepID=A0ABY1WLS9_9GAMM|nr:MULTISPECIES: hypothetical protein [Corallincola]TAA41808.1 hypothetical protein EXY25_16365 [Corallincola spongiicola]TCI02198.1 hypothetical protein EZV61_14780 [Corallincola luteus]